MAGPVVRRKFLPRMVHCVAISGVLFVGTLVRADVGSDRAAAILVFPKIVVDITSPQVAPPAQIDTLIRISNTSNTPITMQCFYVNATPQCTNNSGSCIATPITCSPLTACQPQWHENDFIVTITAGQPVAWLASRGSTVCSQSGDPTLPCLPLSDTRPGPNGQVNNGGIGQITSLVPPVAQDPFVG